MLGPRQRAVMFPPARALPFGGGGTMGNRESRVQEAAAAMPYAMVDLPHLSWEDVEVINQLTGWSLDSYDSPLQEVELSRAWYLARSCHIPPATPPGSTIASHSAFGMSRRSCTSGAWW